VGGEVVVLAGKGVEVADGVKLSDALRILTPEQVLQVDRALAAVGPFGEVRLVKVKGRIRFIQQLKSHDLLQNDRAARGK
jgi:hypothetical protein